MNIDYKYCIWLVSDSSELNDKTNGFEPHISIKTHLNLEEVINMYNKINKNIQLKIKIIKETITSYENGFNALYFNVECLNTKPEWWPNNAHISFIYKYNKPITLLEINKVKKSVNDTIIIFNKIKVMLCKGHHNNWKLIKN